MTRWQERACKICGRMNGQHSLEELAVCQEAIEEEYDVYPERRPSQREDAPNGLTSRLKRASTAPASEAGTD